jgi:hypothetical protein
MHLDDNSLAPYQAIPPTRRYGHASAILGCTLFIHGGISGEDNNVIVDTVKHPNEEFAAFDLQARYWIRAQQEELVNEDTGERTLIHTTLSSLAYHTMTPVFEPALSKSQSDTFYSRMMWVKTPTEIMALPRDKPGMDRCTLKY